jgi:cyclohexadieny/prephenate dehydrogenase
MKKQPIFDQITIIGAGLIGSSLARVIRRDSIAKKLIVADASEDVCKKAFELNFADKITDNLKESVENSDLVILATPVGSFEQIVKQIGPLLKAGSILSDVGSVKQCVIDKVGPYLPDSVHLLPAHPIAGTEHSGPEAGFAELFEGRWCIITPPANVDLRAIEKITAFWEACGMRIELMEAHHHDLVLGITSHLPHLIAYTIVGTAADLEEDIKADVIKYSASGFRGFTRIAASDPVMWRDVFLNNREAVLEILQRFSEDLTALQKSIRRGDGFYLEEVFSRGREIRRHVMELGTAGTPSPEQKDTL